MLNLNITFHGIAITITYFYVSSQACQEWWPSSFWIIPLLFGQLWICQFDCSVKNSLHLGFSDIWQICDKFKHIHWLRAGNLVVMVSGVTFCFAFPMDQWSGADFLFGLTGLISYQGCKMRSCIYFGLFAVCEAHSLRCWAVIPCEHRQACRWIRQRIGSIASCLAWGHFGIVCCQWHLIAATPTENMTDRNAS